MKAYNKPCVNVTLVQHEVCHIFNVVCIVAEIVAYFSLTLIISKYPRNVPPDKQCLLTETNKQRTIVVYFLIISGKDTIIDLLSLVIEVLYFVFHLESASKFSL